jgi:hypothetical protein
VERLLEMKNNVSNQENLVRYFLFYSTKKIYDIYDSL